MNTEVISWYPQVWGGTILEISDSELTDLQWNWGDSVVTARNCSLKIAYAMQEVTYHIYDSTKKGDVTAIHDSKIYLYDTRVEGSVVEIGIGQVFIDGEPYEG